MNTRTETDLLGQIEIDDSKYFGIHTLRALQNFKISNSRISDYPLFVKSLVITKKACALANGDLGTIPRAKVDLIVKGCDIMLADVHKYAWYFPTDVFQGGAGTSVNMNANEVIANRSAEILGGKIGSKTVHPNDHVNCSQSTNDAYPTSIKLAVLLSLKDLLGAMEELKQALEAKAEEFADVLKLNDEELPVLSDFFGITGELKTQLNHNQILLIFVRC